MKICKHFSECGGCRFQDIPYQQQLETKEARVKGLLELSELSTQLKPINSSEQWYYRNKMEFSFGYERGVVCGLYSKDKKRRVVDLEECLIFSSDLRLILEAIKYFLKDNKHSVYDKYSHKGFLRNLIVRETKFTNQLMVGLVTSSSEELNSQSFIDELNKLKLKSKIKSIYWIINDSLSDAVIFDKKELLFGDEFLEERLGDFRFKIGIDTFFQVNPRMIADFYKKLVSYGGLSKDKRVLDLFCGLGSIGIHLANQAKFVWGVEVVKEIVDLAWQNAKLNHIDNISFFTSDVRKFLNTQGIFYRDVDLLVVNPPRSGLSKKIIRAILRLEPKEIIYSSCNPTALFIDLKGLSDQYSIDFIEPFDFFPHTPHLEVLSLLKRK
ncbi:MAG: 23S rRNA (uracil(1939)-C(5))-methyltransferase RlmD [Candidatus Omnitrophica bacterium]|nr:23S rRNA (uracil(1939)-C(5))-methyltransferase RlmD [Candidatus Omnitrophota bacterium]